MVTPGGNDPFHRADDAAAEAGQGVHHEDPLAPSRGQIFSELPNEGVGGEQGHWEGQADGAGGNRIPGIAPFEGPQLGGDPFLEQGLYDSPGHGMGIPGAGEKV